MKKAIALLLAMGLAGCVQEEIPVPEESPNAAEMNRKHVESAIRIEQEAQREAAVMIVQEAVEGHRLLDDEKRYPEDLNQLIESGILTSLPALPGAYAFAYDPSTGKVSLQELGSGAAAPNDKAADESAPADEQPEAGADGPGASGPKS